MEKIQIDKKTRKKKLINLLYINVLKKNKNF